MPKQLNYDMLKESPESALRSVGIKSITAPPVGWTTEYQRQFTWKYSYPPKTKDQEASTGNGLIHANSHSCAMQTDILPPRPPASPKLTHVPLYRDEAIQAAPPKILQNKATQKALTVTSGIQTDLPTARENIAHKPSPVYSDEGIDVDGAAVSPQRISKTAAPLFEFEASPEPAGVPTQFEERPPILSYGWANQNPYNPTYDHRTFNVKTPDMMAEWSKEKRSRKEREQKLQRLEHAKAFAERKRQQFLSKEGNDRSFATEYTQRFRDWTHPDREVTPKIRKQHDVPEKVAYTVPEFGRKQHDSDLMPVNFFAETPAKRLVPVSHLRRHNGHSHDSWRSVKTRKTFSPDRFAWLNN